MGVEKRRLAINISAQLLTFVVQFLISFLLTPFIVNRLGIDAYGFIGLADNFVMYAQLLVVALNSMSLRFVSIAYYRNDIKEANEFASSVLFANLFFAIIVFFINLFLVLFLDNIIDIPDSLVFDVKLLFFLMFLVFEVSIVFSVYQVSTFIKNRLELNSIRSIIANLIRTLVLVVAFACFKPYLFYMGIAMLMCTIYIAVTNYRYTKILTPKIKISYNDFDFSKIKILLSCGLWNTLTKLGNLLGENLDLLLTNLFISAIAMGNLSLAKKMPVLVLTLFSSICVAFGPLLTKSYALNNREEMKKQMFFAIKLISSISIIPLCFLFSISDMFYSLWVPEVDSLNLYFITVIFSLPLVFALALEPIQHIIVITNKVKGYSLATILFNLLNFISLLIIVKKAPSCYMLYYMVGVISFWALWRVGLFLPIYSANCIKEKKTFFYGSLFRITMALLISVSVTLLSKLYFIRDITWSSFTLITLFLVIICFISSWFIILDRESRKRVLTIVGRRINTVIGNISS